jgi:hypothetical protein
MTCKCGTVFCYRCGGRDCICGEHHHVLPEHGPQLATWHIRSGAMNVVQQPVQQPVRTLRWRIRAQAVGRLLCLLRRVRRNAASHPSSSDTNAQEANAEAEHVLATSRVEERRPSAGQVYNSAWAPVQVPVLFSNAAPPGTKHVCSRRCSCAQA